MEEHFKSIVCLFIVIMIRNYALVVVLQISYRVS
jgi:hypothetical protein